MSAQHPNIRALGTHPQEYDIDQIIRGLERMLRRMVPANIDLQISEAHDLPKVHADAVTVGQVLVNLVQNASDAIERNGVIAIRTSRVHVEQASCKSEGAYSGEFVCIEVEDNGIGIPPNELSHIFEAFFTSKNGGMATGLGLTVVDAIMKQQRGWIEVRTRVGCGTRFAVFIPVVERRGR